MQIVKLVILYINVNVVDNVGNGVINVNYIDSNVIVILEKEKEKNGKKNNFQKKELSIASSIE